MELPNHAYDHNVANRWCQPVTMRQHVKHKSRAYRVTGEHVDGSLVLSDQNEKVTHLVASRERILSEKIIHQPVLDEMTNNIGT